VALVSDATTIFGPYEPDKPPFNQTGLVEMGNAYPGANGYRPIGQFQAVTTALPGVFSNAAAFVASDGTAALLGASATGIYRYNGQAWTPLATDLTPPHRWQFTQFGDNIVAVNGGTTKEVNIAANTIQDVPGAPTALCVATVRDFVVYGQANGNASMVQWSAFNNQDGNTPGVDQAGFQPMLTGGFVMGIAGGEYGIIIQRSCVVRMTYTGDADVPFQFDEISANIGAVSRGSIVQVGRNVYFLSDKGFMRCDGNEVVPIGSERVDLTFFKTYPRSILEQMYAAGDPLRNIIAWTMPGKPGMTLVYDYALDKWAPLYLNAQAVVSGFSANVSLDDLDVQYPGGLETIPYSFDDPRFAGGDPLFLVVDLVGEIGTLSGENAPAWFVCALQEYVQGRRARVRNARVLGDALSGVTITLDSRRMLGNSPSIVTTGEMQPSGLMPVRANARYIAPRLDFAAGAAWSFQQGVTLAVEDGGAR
jgi:hypothetical protein